MTEEKDRGRKYDLEERLIEFAVTIIEIVESLPDTRVANHIAGQIIRSGTSAAPNYGEAQSAESRKDFVHKMKVALKELRETRVWLKIALRRGLTVPPGSIDRALSECQELICIFATSIQTAESRDD